MDTDAGALIVFPPVDSIHEFKVQTSAAPASYGVAYEFLRNAALDAKNYFDLTAKPIPPFRMNQFGANTSEPAGAWRGLNRSFARLSAHVRRSPKPIPIVAMFSRHPAEAALCRGAVELRAVARRIASI